VPSTYLHVNYDYLIVLKALEKSEIWRIPKLLAQKRKLYDVIKTKLKSFYNTIILKEIKDENEKAIEYC
jgi:hypothetical protein